jgi:ABC-type branched-subunit amino acid transport system permease subunit
MEQAPTIFGIDLFDFLVFIAKIGVSILAIAGAVYIAKLASKDDFDNNW